MSVANMNCDGFRSLLADQLPGFPQPAHYADLDF